MTVALLVPLEAKAGKEAEVVNFLRGGLSIVQEEPATVLQEFALVAQLRHPHIRPRRLRILVSDGVGRRWPLMLLLAALAALGSGCGAQRVQRTLVAPSQVTTLDHKSPYLKAHLRSGYVYVFSSWRVDSASAVVTGRGTLLTPNRSTAAEGEFRLPADSVALFETNVLRRSGSVTALSVLTGITAAVAGICIASPKTCFGSCPTFYVPDSAGYSLQAEGFSASIAPALEATDVDALYRAQPKGRDFRIRLTNEGLETHVIRYADLLAVRRPAGGRVFLTPEGEFRGASEVIGASRCADASGDCLEAIAAFDGRERTSLADSIDLATRETIDLGFDRVPAGAVGLVITSRQSLMSTFLLYQALAYLGTNAPQWLAALESEGPAARERAQGIGRLLGGIEVLVPDSGGGWTVVGTVGETGPLAPDTKVVPLPRSDGGPLQVRLRLTRGLWRLDYVALAHLRGSLQAIRIPPTRVERDGRGNPVAWHTLVDRSRSLITMPGDAYELIYRLPDLPDRYELFLESRGYYLEWMRREWLAEENMALAARMLLDPAGALRALAPAYKRQEAEMEALFWNSRYVRR